MLSGIQIIGAIFGLVMLYLSRLYYMRKEIGRFDFLMWLIIWLGYLYAVLFPQTLNVFLEGLGLISGMHLFTIVSFMVAFGILFHLYRITKKMQSKMEKLVSEVAHQGMKK